MGKDRNSLSNIGRAHARAQARAQARAHAHTPLERLALEPLTQCDALTDVTRADGPVVGPKPVVDVLVVIQPHLSNPVEVTALSGN